MFPYENKFRFEEIKQKSCHLSRSPMSAKYTLQERIIILVDDTAIKGVWLCTEQGRVYGCNLICLRFNQRLKRGERYSDVVGFIRRRLRFDLLRTCVIALRGFKKNAAPEKIEDLEFNLRPVAASY